MNQEIKSDKELLELLQKEIPYKWRIQSHDKNNPCAYCVAYIDSRQVQDRLDSIFGLNWSCSYYSEKGNLFCSITITLSDGRIITRSDCGTESKQDKEKGEASDAFKRAAVKFGIGRFLYNLPIYKIKTNEVKGNKNNPYPVDDFGKRIYNLTQFINGKIKSNQHYQDIKTDESKQDDYSKTKKSDTKKEQPKDKIKPEPKKQDNTKIIKKRFDEITTTEELDIACKKAKKLYEKDKKTLVYLEHYYYERLKQIIQADFESCITLQHEGKENTAIIKLDEYNEKYSKYKTPKLTEFIENTYNETVRAMGNYGDD